MIETVDIPWVERKIDDPSVCLLDPRPPVKYFQGHLRNAVNFPVARLLFSKESYELKPIDELEKALGNAGVDANSTVVIYDSYDGQSGAMLAWTLEYLGHRDVKLLDVFLEKWISEGNPIFYRPVTPKQKSYHANLNNAVRTSADEIVPLIRNVSVKDRVKIIDFRSPAEYGGKDVMYEGQRPGHIPGAVNLPWLELLGKKDVGFFTERNDLTRVFSQRTQQKDLATAEIICYCGMGPRAALGYVALRVLDCSKVSLYDRSYNEWSKREELPVEV